MRFNNDKPIFTQIADLLAADIVSGRLAQGDRIPSARDLATSLEVNPNTAARSLQMLSDAGIARCERGTGYFVADNGPELVKAERRKKFFNEDLPHLWKTMDELGLSIDEILARKQNALPRPAHNGRTEA